MRLNTTRWVSIFGIACLTVFAVDVRAEECPDGAQANEFQFTGKVMHPKVVNGRCEFRAEFERIMENDLHPWNLGGEDGGLRFWVTPIGSRCPKNGTGLSGVLKQCPNGKILSDEVTIDDTRNWGKITVEQYTDGIVRSTTPSDRRPSGAQAASQPHKTGVRKGTSVSPQ
jgi:hypothetical protein